jgi:hypothetical protein
MHTNFLGKPESKRPPCRPSRRCENNIEVDLREIDLNGVDWIFLTQDRDWW